MLLSGMNDLALGELQIGFLYHKSNKKNSRLSARGRGRRIGKCPEKTRTLFFVQSKKRSFPPVFFVPHLYPRVLEPYLF
jgi:hypothetical protein